MRHIKLHAVVKMAAAKLVGYHREVVTLAILQEMRAFAARARCALLSTGTLAHEHAVLRGHELLTSDDGKAELDGAFLRQIGDLGQVELGREPDPLRAKARRGLQGKRIGDGQVRPYLYAGARLVSANELPEAFGHDGLIGVNAAPGIEAACMFARELAVVMVGDGQHNGACLRIACLFGGFRELAGDGGLAMRQVDRRNVHLIGTSALCRPSAGRVGCQHRDMDAAGMRREHSASRLHARQRALGRALEQRLLK